MGVLWSAAINAARDFSPAFDRQSTPDIVALRQGARYQQGLLAAIAESKLDRVHVTQSIPLPLVRFDQGVQLDPYIRVHGATAYTTDAVPMPINVELIEYPERLDGVVAGLRMPDRLWPPTWLGQPSGYIEAGFLKLLGTAENWTSIGRVDVDLFPVGPDEVQLHDTLALPGQPLRACVADLAAFMGLRAGVAMPDPSGARESYLDEVTERRRVKVGQIREVWSVLLPLALSLPSAGMLAPAGMAPSRSLGTDVEVVAAVGVSARTFGLREVAGGDRVASKRVDAARDGLQMQRVAARPISAQVVEREVAGNRADELDERLAVHEEAPRLTIDGSTRVAVSLALLARPRPTDVGAEIEEEVRESTVEGKAHGLYHTPSDRS